MAAARASRHDTANFRHGARPLARLAREYDLGPMTETQTPGPNPTHSAAWLGESLTGRVLIAMPGIGDPRFERAVILMCIHSKDQTMGLSLNRPVDGLRLREVISSLGIPDADQAPDHAVLEGGPVQKERGFVLHTDDFSAGDASLPIANGVSLTTTRDALSALTDPASRPSCALLALGYAGWSPGQLEEELAANVWLAADADLSLVFDTDYAEKWSRALAKLGVTPDRLSATGGRA